MRVRVGSKNEVKIEAVREALALYEMFNGAEVEGVAASSDVSEQPKSLEETVRGAQNRARSAFEGCEWSVGIESGLVEVPYTKSGYMDLTAVALYDGEEMHVGLSPAIELPKRVVDIALQEQKDLNVACREAGLTEVERLGDAQGFVGLLTDGRINRKGYTKHAIIMAMAHVTYGEA